VPWRTTSNSAPGRWRSCCPWSRQIPLRRHVDKAGSAHGLSKYRMHSGERERPFLFGFVNSKLGNRYNSYDLLCAYVAYEISILYWTRIWNAYTLNDIPKTYVLDIVASHQCAHTSEKRERICVCFITPQCHKNVWRQESLWLTKMCSGKTVLVSHLKYI
jgi:hypothetical protein